MTLTLGAELCTYLQGKSLPTALNFSGAPPVNCFATFLPDTPDLAVAVMERGGMTPLSVLIGNVGSAARLPVSRFDRPNVQIMTRSAAGDYLTGNALAEAIFGALQGLGEQYLNGSSHAYFHIIRALQSPVYLGQMGARERHIWSQNFAIWWTNPQR